MPRRSYDQYCPLSRALDVIGERWTVLIVRELLAGPRRYTDLHADLPAVSTDALRAHWFALPLLRELADLAIPCEGVVDIRLDEGTFHVLINGTGPAYAHGPAAHADARLTMGARACLAVSRGHASLPEMIKKGEVGIDGDGPLARALRSQ